MKYILMMTGNKSDFEAYASWSKDDLQANVAFMRAFSKELKDSGVFVSTEGPGWPSEAKLVRAGKNGKVGRLGRTNRAARSHLAFAWDRGARKRRPPPVPVGDTRNAESPRAAGLRVG